MPHCKILILGCDSRVGVKLCVKLGERGFAVLCQGFGDIDGALSEFRPDLVVARPQEESAVEALAWVHARSDAPVLLLLRAGGDRESLIGAFRAGADDVVMESPDLEEVVMRVEAILRRVVMRQGLQVLDVTIDPDAHAAWRGDRRLDLTDIEFDLLAMLVRNAGVVVSKRQMLAEVWGFEHYSVNVVEVHVSALRRKMQALGPAIIETVRAHGYVIRGDHAAVAGQLCDDRVPSTWISPEELIGAARLREPRISGSRL